VNFVPARGESARQVNDVPLAAAEGAGRTDLEDSQGR
jgi:hypothetical protein